MSADESAVLELGRGDSESRERVRTLEAARAEAEARFRLLVESVRDYAIFMLDPEGNVTSWNAGAERIKGYHCRRDHRPALLALLSARGRTHSRQVRA